MSLNYGYTGEPTDENNLVYLRARCYNRNTGTFLSLDPYEGDPTRPMSLNRYAYAEGNPVNNTDHSGLCVDNDRNCIEAVHTLENEFRGAYVYWRNRPGLPENNVFPQSTVSPASTPNPPEIHSVTLSPEPTPTLAICPTPTPESNSTPTPGTPFPTLQPTPTGRPELHGTLNPKEWTISEIQLLHEAIRVFNSGRGFNLFNVPFVRESTVTVNGIAADGAVVGNENYSTHPDGASVTVKLSDSWSNRGRNDIQYGKWIVSHELSHAYLWLRFETFGRYSEINNRAVKAFIRDIGIANAIFPTEYAENRFDSGTEYLAEAMVAMIWNKLKQNEASPSTSPHIYENNVDDIVNIDGVSLPEWIQERIPGFMNIYP